MSTIPPLPAFPGNQRTQSEKIDYTVLYEKRLTNSVTGPAEESFGKEDLAADERWAITHIEFIPPFSGGAPEEYGELYLVVDGRTYRGGTSFRPLVDGSNNMLPPLTHVWSQPKPSIIMDFHAAWQPLPQSPVLIGGVDPKNPLRDTSIKVKRSLEVKARVLGSVTAPRTVRIWGYRFKGRSTVERIYGQSVNYTLNFYDPTTNRRVNVTKTVPDPFNNWTKLVGGDEQEGPSIEVLYRYAQPTQATEPNEDYSLKYDERVANEWNNMYFDLVAHSEEIIIITHLGVRPHDNQRLTVAVVNEQERPEGGFPTRTNAPALNPLHFGRAQPELALPDNIYFPLHTLETPILIANEIGYVAIRDNGTSIPAPTSILQPPVVAMRAYRIVVR